MHSLTQSKSPHLFYSLCLYSSSSPHLFYSLFRSLLNACHPPSPLLFSVPLVSIRLPRLWTILCPVSVVLGQPALRAARKVMFTPRTQSTFVRCSCCFNLYNSQLHLSPPLRFRGAARACSFSVSRCGCLGRRNSRGRGEFQCTQLGYWVDGCFGGADLTVFSCGKHKHTVGQSVLVVQTHTNRLSHFSFFLPANFLHLLFFPFSLNVQSNSFIFYQQITKTTFHSTDAK